MKKPSRLLVFKWLLGLLCLPLLLLILYQAGWCREALAGWVGMLGPTGVPLLRRSLADGDPHVRLAAAAALTRIGPAAAPPLIRNLSDPDPEVRASAADALGFLGPVGKEAVPALRKALHDPDDRVREHAVRALVGALSDPSEVVGDLIDALHDRDDAVRAEAADGLWRLGRGLDVVVGPHLVRALHDPDAAVRAAAAEALGKAGVRGEAVTAALREAAADSDPRVQDQAKESLEVLEHDPAAEGPAPGQGAAEAPGR